MYLHIASKNHPLHTQETLKFHYISHCVTHKLLQVPLRSSVDIGLIVHVVHSGLTCVLCHTVSINRVNHQRQQRKGHQYVLYSRFPLSGETSWEVVTHPPPAV